MSKPSLNFETEVIKGLNPCVIIMGWLQACGIATGKGVHGSRPLNSGALLAGPVTSVWRAPHDLPIALGLPPHCSLAEERSAGYLWLRHRR